MNTCRGFCCGTGEGEFKRQRREDFEQLTKRSKKGCLACKYLRLEWNTYDGFGDKDTRWLYCMHPKESKDGWGVVIYNDCGCGTDLKHYVNHCHQDCPIKKRTKKRKEKG